MPAAVQVGTSRQSPLADGAFLEGGETVSKDVKHPFRVGCTTP